ncbi:hypothetical protein [Silvibacterium acidisoli]|uniref:hypothetical protein n=1 Tax=Acidobacteriaceae bacterium ZG23-2 TaxID=2883246 RepID=UPI00406C273B
MRNLDFSSLHALITTLLSLAVITLLGVGIRLLTQVTIQQRRERMNRQINERLRALIAAYKTLGGSFTGDLTVNPAHRRDLRQQDDGPAVSPTPLDLSAAGLPGSDRARRIRDAVEAALSDIILLGTEEQVRLAANAAHELATGKLVHTQELVVSLRSFIREALDLDPIPSDVAVPLQGPARPSASGGKDKAEKGEGRQGGGGGMGGMGGGMGGGFGLGSGSPHETGEEEDSAGSSAHHS